MSYVCEHSSVQLDKRRVKKEFISSSDAGFARQVQKGTAQDVTRQAWELLIEQHSTREAIGAAPRRRPIATRYSIRVSEISRPARRAGRRPSRQNDNEQEWCVMFTSSHKAASSSSSSSRLSPPCSRSSPSRFLVNYTAAVWRGCWSTKPLHVRIQTQ